MRKLASIQIIKDIQPIENSDNLLVATVLGWKIVINKSYDFKVGDKVVYFEIDSFLPIKPEFEFLRNTSYKNSPILGEGFRLKTIRLRGQISQGLILPIEVCFNGVTVLHDFQEGEDVTEFLGVKKWEEPEQAQIGGATKGKRPAFVEKSSEARIQSNPGLLNEFDVPYYITTKYDGSSHFIAYDDSFHFGSHNFELKPTDKKGSFYEFIVENDLESKLKQLKEKYSANQIYIIGEWCGEGIQKNRLNLQRPCWYMFTINVDGRRLGLEDLLTIRDEYNIPMVEIEELGSSLTKQYPTVENLLERAEENRRHVYPGKCEGIVIRPIQPVFSHILNGPLSMKVINNNYLL